MLWNGHYGLQDPAINALGRPYTSKILRNFLAQEIAGRFIRVSIFFDKILAATILQVILRKILAKPFT